MGFLPEIRFVVIYK